VEKRLASELFRMQEEKTSTALSRCSGVEGKRVLRRRKREEESDLVNSTF
jgi:hypothetical protein